MSKVEQDEFMKYGARVYFYRDGTILIKQTILKNNRYVIDSDAKGKHKEAHSSIGIGQAKQVLNILNEASEGKLKSGNMFHRH